jgi:GntP family gluconate:H+ symporter
MWLVVLLALSIVFIVLATTKLKMHPFLALLLTAFGFGILSGMPLKDVVDSVNKGFGGTIGYIGIVILAGAIIGAFLEKSGGAYRLATSILKLTGERQVPLAMGFMGYVVSIPVFCDSAFVLLAPLMRALASKAGITLASAAVALSLGLYATHTMVPPTPGPVAAAGILGADLGLVIMWGMAVGLVSMIAGWLFAILVASRVYISPDAGKKRMPTQPLPLWYPRRRMGRPSLAHCCPSFSRSFSSSPAPSASYRANPSERPALSRKCWAFSDNPWWPC